MTDWAWVSNQLGHATTPVAEATVSTLEAFEKAAEKRILTDDERRTVLEYVQKLALGHAILFIDDSEEWGPVIPGEYSVGDTVRVRSDAYTGPAATKHNGKRGRILSAHRGQTQVLYDDAANSEESNYHDPDKLERLL